MPVGWILEDFGNCFLQPGMQKIWGRCTKSSERLFWNGACGGSASKSGKKGRTAGTAGRIYLFQRVLEWLDTGVLSVYSEKKFKEIEAGLPVREVVEMYPALHEAPEDKFVEAADRIIRRKEQGKNALRRIRKMAGYTKRIFQSNRGLRCGVFSSMNREKRRFKSIRRNRACACTVTGMPDGRFAVIAKGLDSFNLL